LRAVFGEVARISDTVTRDAPRWLRPLARTGLVLGFLLLMAIALPFTPLLRKQQIRLVRDWEEETRPVHELRSHARRVWIEESPTAAAELVRGVYDRLRATPGGVEIPPYGRFAGVACMSDLASAAYEYAFSAGRFPEAIEIAEFMAEQPTGRFGSTWIVSRARCLARLGRAAEAKELLLANRDLYDPDAAVNRALEELRESDG
jgi:hypothetical protein